MLNKKRLLRLTVAFALSLALLMTAACNLVPNENPDASSIPGSTSKFTEAELASPLIEIGEFTVTLEEYLNIYDEVVAYYQQYGYDILSNPEEHEKYKSLMIDTLVEEHMMLYRASELGLDNLSSEQLLEVEESRQSTIQEMYDYYTQMAESEIEAGSTQTVDELVEQFILEEAQYQLGSNATVDEYMEYLGEAAHDEYVVSLLEDYLAAGITIPEASMQAWYDENLEGDEEYYEEHPETYMEERSTFDITGTLSDGVTAAPPLYVPEGYSRVLHIYTTADGELSDEYVENETKMEELIEEYGRLSLESKTLRINHTARLAEIEQEYKELYLANETEFEEFFSDAKTKIDEAYQKLEAGDSFLEVMLQYTEDTSVLENTALQDRGQLITTEYVIESGDWSNEIKTVFAELTLGEYSSVIKDADGFHIILYLSDEAPGAVPFETVKGDIEAMLIEQEKAKVLEDQVAEWLEDAEGIIKINEELLAEIGNR